MGTSTAGKKVISAVLPNRIIALQSLMPTVQGALTRIHGVMNAFETHVDHSEWSPSYEKRADSLRVNKSTQANRIAVDTSTHGARPPKPTSEALIADYVARGLECAVDQGFERVITNPDILASVARLLVGVESPVPRRRALPAAA